MMLEHIGEAAASTAVMKGVEAVTGTRKMLTPDMGGKGTTGEMTRAISAHSETP